MLSALEERSTLFTTPPQVSGMYNTYDIEAQTVTVSRFSGASPERL